MLLLQLGGRYLRPIVLVFCEAVQIDTIFAVKYLAGIHAVVVVAFEHQLHRAINAIRVMLAFNVAAHHGDREARRYVFSHLVTPA